ncbi:hypothetical protein [Flagellimonas sp.]|uniref:hypothetical protein n=1 Tax=Flagellimonas sp. TaxID=2058762 RepID=UPI003B5CB3D7
MDQLSTFQQTSFYEYITFVASSMLFSVLLMIGLSQYDSTDGELFFLMDKTKLTTGISVLVIFIFLMISHIYGQTVSALSEKVIGKPLKWINKKIIKHPDFKGKYDKIVAKIDTSSLVPNSKKNNKWTLLYFILSKNKDVGTDLMKRYAREKVSRINSMNFLILFLLSIWVKIFPVYGEKFYPSLFSLWSTSIILLIVFLIFCYEYFQRRCWNSDLLTKSIAVFLV